MQPIERSSNWDFTPVISLLHSPAYGSGDTSAPYRHTDSGTSLNGRVDNVDSQGKANGTREHPKLGDFGSLWGLLGHTSTASLSEKKPRAELRSEDAISSRPTADKPKQITILKRPSSNVKNADPFPKMPSPASKSIPVPGTPQRRKSKGKADSRNTINDCGINKASSENNSLQSTETESDGGPSVFDPPLQNPATSLIPRQVGPSTTKSPPLDTPPSSYDSVESTLNADTVKNLPKDGHVVQPTYKSTKDRKIGLLTKLLKGFPDYADIMSQVGRPARNNAKDSSSRPIHVFVDLSNIMVGFHDSMKVSRGIPITTRVPRLPFSFENFSLVLERGRKTEKRVLVGSDRYRETGEAEKAGYETNILDRVQKGRYLAQRPLRTRKGQRHGAKQAIVSETNGMAEERWVEQGVDEILHLKILESLIDTEQPATIVLATGDAAEAEYSEGFMKMVERALKRGWMVELVRDRKSVV